MTQHAARLTPEAVEAAAHATSRFGIAFGRRFLLLLAIGFAWIVPTFWDVRWTWAIVLWDAIAVSAWALDAWRLPAAGVLVVRRTWPAMPMVFAASQVEVSVRNTSRSTIVAAIVDTIPRTLATEPPDLRLTVEADGEAGISYGIEPRTRGPVEVGDAYIRYRSRLCLAERWARASLSQNVVVYPRLDEVRRGSLAAVRNEQLLAERRARRLTGAGRSYRGLREHQPGDDFRDVCWTATARRAKLVTRLYEPERSQPVWIVLDTGRLMRARVGRVTKLDMGVDAALSLSHAALNAGDRVGLLSYGLRVDHRLPVARGASHLRQLIESLAVLRPGEAEADHYGAAAAVFANQKQRSFVVWITDVPDAALTPDVAAAAVTLMPRHLVLFVIVGQPDLRRVAARQPASVDEMYETTAAQEIVHRRDVLLGRLRANGALTIEADARLAPSVVNAYLDVKLRNRL